MSQRDYTNWVEGRGDGAKPHDYSPEKYQTQAWCTSDGTWYDFGETGRPSWSCGAPYRVRLRQHPRDYGEWVEGKGDSAKPPDFDTSPEKYEVQVESVYGVWVWSLTPFCHTSDTYRVRVRRPEQTTQPEHPAQEPTTPTTPTAPEPPVLKSLVIRPDGCVVLIGGTSVKISHSAALDLAGELCRSRRQ